MKVLAAQGQSDDALTGSFAALCWGVINVLKEKFPAALETFRSIKLCQNSSHAYPVLFDREKHDLLVFPENFIPGVRPDMVIYEKIGKVFWDGLSKDAQRDWSEMLTTVDQSTCERVCEAFSADRPFSDSVESLNSPVDRLVAVHVANSLMQVSLRPTSLEVLSPQNIPAAKGLLTGQTKFSLVPLVTAYGHKDLLDYCRAFARLMMTGSFGIKDASVEARVQKLFEQTR